ncbi:TPA: type II secretion system minor pseudopilin GspH [Providencia rettgeri]
MIHRGFTLLELMLVIFLMALIVSVITYTWKNQSISPSQKEAQRFYEILTQLKEKAQIRGETLGILLQKTNYTFMERNNYQWKKINHPKLSSHIILPISVNTKLHMGEFIWQTEYESELQRRRLDIHDIQLELQQNEKNLVPQIWILPYEPIPPFSLQFYQQEKEDCWQVSLTLNGQPKLNSCQKDAS